MSPWSISWDAQFFTGLLSIVMIDLLLAGDNAVVIAMAVRGLAPSQRRRGIVLGALAAVLLRVVLTFFVAQLLRLSFVKLAGGTLILWVAAKLFLQGGDADEKGDHAAGSVREAIKIIVVADATMSLDNMLAVGGASHGNVFLLLFGLALSIPFVIFTSNLLSKLMQRFPIIVYAGAGILGKVSAEMILTDPFVQARFSVTPSSVYLAEAVFAAAVIAMGIGLSRRKARRTREKILDAATHAATDPHARPIAVKRKREPV
jgi:YjbE family integral membrane protein